MFNLRPVLFLLGVLLAPMGFFMLLPALFLDSASGAFFFSALFTIFVATSIVLGYREKISFFTIPQAFILSSLVWIMLPLFATLPFLFALPHLSFTDALFESISGITTTGATVMVGLDDLPKSVLMWRALLQWIGGIGTILTAIAILPFLRVGGMQIFQVESSGSSEKIIPHMIQLAGQISLLYFVLSLFCVAAYFLAGLPLYESVAHAMTTVSTGGFSTSDQSFGVFDNTQAEIIASFFMIVGSLPFVLYLQAFHKKGKLFLSDDQMRFFFVVLFMAFFLLLAHQLWQGVPTSFGETLIHVFFNATSVMTGTGYASVHYGEWGALPILIFLTLTFIGGCAGSTSCGIKIFRVLVALRIIRSAFYQLFHPHRIVLSRYNDVPISDSIASSVMSFIFLYILIWALIASILSFTGLDPLTALSAAATSLSNVGPGLGPIIGPDGNFSSLSDFAKWILAFAMLVGRLELFTILIFFTPSFWRR